MNDWPDLKLPPINLLNAPRITMSTYTPDSWAIVEIVTEKHGKIYKVLASWYGGFTRGDSWKLSSGVESVVFDDGVFTMPQSSGSVYVCGAGAEHVSGIMGSIFSSFVKEAEESGGAFTIRIVEMAEFMELLKADPKLLEH